MSLEIRATSIFQRRVKKLRKRYPSIANDLEGLQAILLDKPQAGEAIPGLYERVRKIRLASSDLKKGKSGGFRVIYFYLAGDGSIYLLDIYAKSDKDNVEINEIKRILQDNSLVLEEEDK